MSKTSINPFVKVDKDYSDAIAVAIDVFGVAVAPLNEQLEEGLIGLEDFEDAVAVFRTDFRSALAAAEDARESDKQTQSSDYAAHLAELQQVADAAQVERAALKAKFEAGTASAADIQTAIAELLT